MEGAYLGVSKNLFVNSKPFDGYLSPRKKSYENLLGCVRGELPFPVPEIGLGLLPKYLFRTLRRYCNCVVQKGRVRENLNCLGYNIFA